MIIVSDKMHRRPLACVTEFTCILFLALAFALGVACTAWGIVLFLS